MIEDPDSDKPYFFHSGTSKTQWALPKDVEAKFGAKIGLKNKQSPKGDNNREDQDDDNNGEGARKKPKTAQEPKEKDREKKSKQIGDSEVFLFYFVFLSITPLESNRFITHCFVYSGQDNIYIYIFLYVYSHYI